MASQVVYQISEELSPILKLFQKTEVEGTFPDSLYVLFIFIFCVLKYSDILKNISGWRETAHTMFPWSFPILLLWPHSTGPALSWCQSQTTTEKTHYPRWIWTWKSSPNISNRNQQSLKGFYTTTKWDLLLVNMQNVDSGWFNKQNSVNAIHCRRKNKTDVILIGTEKNIRKIHYLFITKTLNKSVTEENCINIKALLEKIRMPTLTTSIKHSTGSPSQSNNARKGNKDDLIYRKP